MSKDTSAPADPTADFRYTGESPRVLIAVQRLDGSTLLGEPGQVYRLAASTVHPLLTRVRSKPEASDVPDVPPPD